MTVLTLRSMPREVIELLLRAAEMEPAWGEGDVERRERFGGGEAKEAEADAADAEAASAGDDADALSVCSGCHEVDGGGAPPCAAEFGDRAIC